MVRQERQGAVAILVIDAPPVNALGAAVRAGLMAGLEQARAAPDVAAVVIRSDGRMFSAGADITEFGKPAVAPPLSQVIATIEALAKPVVAALHGAALGGGLELALGAHARVALAGASLGLPEVALGLLPGAGGTQRLPRLIGAAPALRMMLTGRPVTAVEALALGLVDGVAEAGLTEAAVALAQDMALHGQLVATRNRCNGLADPARFLAEVADARATIDPRLPAPGRIVDCVSAVVAMPFDQGLQAERAAFVDLVASPQFAALRHAFQAERRLARTPEADAVPRTVASVALLDHDPQNAAVLAATGLRLLDPRDSAMADLVLAALPPDPGDLFRAVAAGAILAVSTDWPHAVACAGERAGDLIGFHPVGAGLVEVGVAVGSAPQAVAAGLAVARRAGRRALRVSMGQGPVLPQMQAAMVRVIDRLEVRGTPRATIDAALMDFGLVPAPAGALPPVAPGADAICRRCLTALANDGARLLGHGAVLRPSDLDAAAIAGLGFPRWQGGPMFWADRRGLAGLRDDILTWSETDPDLWQVAPLIDELIRSARSLADLNAD